MVIRIYSLLADGIMNEAGYNYLFDYSQKSVVNTIDIIAAVSYLTNVITSGNSATGEDGFSGAIYPTTVSYSTLLN